MNTAIEGYGWTLYRFDQKLKLASVIIIEYSITEPRLHNIWCFQTDFRQ